MGDGAAVTFHRKFEGQWQDLGAIMISELPTKWPMIVDHLAADAFFSINSTYQQTRSKRISEVTGLPIYSRKAERLRWLNALILDIDRHEDRQFRFDVLLEMFRQELLFTGIPAPNLVVSSGRGLWALWLIRDHAKISRPVPAFEERRSIYQRVNIALVERFGNLGTDPSATDPSRVMRIPGSINTTAAPEISVVQFFEWSADVHTLPELAGILGVAARKIRLPDQRLRLKDDAKTQAALTRWRIPLEGFRRLWGARGQFSKGVRRRAVWVYALLLRKNRMSQTEIFRLCLELADSCKPTLTAAEVRRCISASAKAALRPFHQSISNAAIATMLRISEREKAVLPNWFKPKREMKSSQIARRRAAIRQELEVAGHWCADRAQWISARQMSGLLAEKYAFKVTHATVLKDYRTLRQDHFGTLAPSPPQPQSGKFPVLVQGEEEGISSAKKFPVAQPTPFGQRTSLRGETAGATVAGLGR